jgi:hypothetical protein
VSGKYYPQPTLHRHKVPHQRSEDILRADPGAVSMLLKILRYPLHPRPQVPATVFKFTVIE